MNRRDFAGLALLVCGALLAGGHTPYPQWSVYRRRNLFVVASRTDERAYALAEAAATLLATHLPDSRAQPTRATDIVRVASLLATAQIDIGILRRDEVAPMVRGEGQFAGIGAFPLWALMRLDEHLLLAGKEFRDRHAYLVVAALVEHSAELPVAAADRSAPPFPVPLHAGAKAFYLGQNLPDEPAAKE